MKLGGSFSWIVGATVVVAGCTAALSGERTTLDQLQRHLLKGDWESIVGICKACDPNEIAQSPVLRGILGHACLATNRNNESLGYFISLVGSGDLDAWSRWTSAFVTAYPDNPVALYLQGDALARQGKWQEAVAAYCRSLKRFDSLRSLADTAGSEANYDEALEKMEGKLSVALALNARGVARVLLRDLDTAFLDFVDATQLAPAFADAHASLATCLLLQEAAPGAMAEYDRALNNSHKFTLARNGQACAEIGYSRDPNSIRRAVENFNSVIADPAVRELAEANIRDVIQSCLTDRGDESSDANEGAFVSAKELMGLSSDTQKTYLSQQSPARRQELLKQIDNHISNNQLGLQLFGGTNASLGFDLGAAASKAGTGAGARISGQAHGHSGVFEGQLRQNIVKLEAIRENILVTTPGGGDTRGAGLDNSVGDMGAWPAKHMWFGLMPRVSLAADRERQDSTKEDNHVAIP